MAQNVVSQPSAPRIGDYQILTKIGQGGIAEVYKGLQTSLQREVAIKILSPQYNLDSEIVRRFERESVLIARLNHPNIVHVIDKGTKGGRYYFVMEYIDGTDFKSVIQDPSVDLKTKIDIVIQVCKALDFAHKNGVIHRDIKPANILIDRQGNARVADFGIAQFHGRIDHEVTSSDMVMGTAAYMAPEQKLSSAGVTAAADIFSLGVILYEIACGRRPEGHFKMPSEIDRNVPKETDAIIMRCLAQLPGERYSTAAELKDALLNAFGGDTYSSKQADIAVTGVDSFVGKCRFLDTIKETRYGATYLVENKQAGKLFVIKKTERQGAGLKEATILSRLRHENIVTVVGAGGDHRKTVIVTEYMPGGSLADRLAKTYTWQEAITIAMAIARALDFAHKNNIIHGDLRPSNVLFDQSEQTKVTDFGYPPHYEGKKDWFAPPEKKQSRQGDIYALGVILHILLTGRNLQFHPSGQPDFKELTLRIPKPITDILSKMLQSRPSDRYQEVGNLLHEYDDYMKSIEVSSYEAGPYPIQNTREKKRLIPGLIAAAMSVGVILALFWDSLFK